MAIPGELERYMTLDLEAILVDLEMTLDLETLDLGMGSS